jgi:hypothetical protein
VQQEYSAFEAAEQMLSENGNDPVADQQPLLFPIPALSEVDAKSERGNADGHSVAGSEWDVVSSHSNQ